MGKKPPKWLPGERVNETILMQRKSVEQLRVDRQLRRDKEKTLRDKEKNKQEAKRKRRLQTPKFISAQTILSHAERDHRQARQYHKIGEKTRGRLKKAGAERGQKRIQNAPIVLLIRCKGNLIPFDVRFAFKKMGLLKLYSGRLLRLQSPEQLARVEQLRPFSLVGYPSAEQLERLLRTRGCLWDQGRQSRRFISGNRLLEEVLGKYNVLCIEDLVDVVVNKREHVDKVLQHLAPFDFHHPRQLFSERHRSVHEKMEVVNPNAFALFLNQQLHTDAQERKLASGKKKTRLVKGKKSHQEAAPVSVASATVQESAGKDSINAESKTTCSKSAKKTPAASLKKKAPARAPKKATAKRT